MIRMLLPEAWKDQSIGDCFIVEILISCNVLACWIKTVVWSYSNAQVIIDQSMWGKLKTRQITLQLNDRVVFQHFVSDRKDAFEKRTEDYSHAFKWMCRRIFVNVFDLHSAEECFSALLFTKVVVPLPHSVNPTRCLQLKWQSDYSRERIRMIYGALISLQIIFYETPNSGIFSRL